jgi:hypothetical protein
LGLGVALDTSDLLRKNLLLRVAILRIESDEERTRRLKVLGRPTCRGRHDWLQHFVVSAALTAQFGPEAAERIGLGKEMLDAQRGSGFSFADLAADYAGVAFARELLEEKSSSTRIGYLADRFRGDDFVPRLDDLEEGLNEKAFADKYGGTADERFRQQTEKIRRRLREMPGFGGRP